MLGRQDACRGKHARVKRGGKETTRTKARERWNAPAGQNEPGTHGAHALPNAPAAHALKPDERPQKPEWAATTANNQATATKQRDNEEKLTHEAHDERTRRHAGSEATQPTKTTDHDKLNVQPRTNEPPVNHRRIADTQRNTKTPRRRKCVGVGGPTNKNQ